MEIFKVIDGDPDRFEDSLNDEIKNGYTTIVGFSTIVDPNDSSNIIHTAILKLDATFLCMANERSESELKLALDIVKKHVDDTQFQKILEDLSIQE